MSEQSTPTGVLREEHQLILQVLDALEMVLNSGEQRHQYDFDAIEKCTSFFRLFADACHHGKEEDLLFPELETRGVPREGGPIGVMLAEHQQGRAFVRQMREALPEARSGQAAALATLIQAGRGYIDLLRQHIDKEDNVLFMMADRVVDQTACERLCANYARVCSGKFDGHTKQQLQEQAAALTPDSTTGDPIDQ